MLSVAEAQHAILHHFNPLPAEAVPLLESLARVLAEDVVSAEDLPPFDSSAMDGYAVRAAEHGTDEVGQLVRAFNEIFSADR